MATSLILSRNRSWKGPKGIGTLVSVLYSSNWKRDLWVILLFWVDLQMEYRKIKDEVRFLSRTLASTLDPLFYCYLSIKSTISFPDFCLLMFNCTLSHLPFDCFAVNNCIWNKEWKLLGLQMVILLLVMWCLWIFINRVN